MSKFEDTICDQSLPVNTIACLNRMIEILQENETNSFQGMKSSFLTLEVERYTRCLWFLNQQVFGQMAEIDMSDLWYDLCKDQ